MKTYTVTLSISMSVHIDADSEKQARAQALVTLHKEMSEFDRRVVSVEDITPIVRHVRRGLGSY